MAQVKVDVDTDTMRETAREFARWIDALESGEMTLPELLSEMRVVVNAINELTDDLARSFQL